VAKKDSGKKENKEPAGEDRMPTENEVTEPAGIEKPKEEAVSSFEEELEAVQEEARKNWDMYLRARADLENFRKRAQREKEELARFANESILREVLPVADNLERAVEHASREEGGGEGLLEGVEMTLSQFRKVLEKFGLTVVDAVGRPFDPSRHEAMGQVESAQHQENTVAQELQKGYMLNDRLLRPSLVMVSKAPEANKSPADE